MEQIQPKTAEEIAIEQQLRKKKAEEVKSFDVSIIYDNNNPSNELYKKMAESFKRTHDFSPSKAN